MQNSEEHSNHTPEELIEISELSKRGYQLLKESLTDRAIENFKKIIIMQPDNNYALVGTYPVLHLPLTGISVENG